MRLRNLESKLLLWFDEVLYLVDEDTFVNGNSKINKKTRIYLGAVIRYYLYLEGKWSLDNVYMD